jgi:hypothetical protein
VAGFLVIAGSKVPTRSRANRPPIPAEIVHFYSYAHLSVIYA